MARTPKVKFIDQLRPPTGELHSGMELLDVPERHILFEKTHDSHSLYYHAYGRSDGIRQANKLINNLAGIDGIEVLERGAYGRDYKNRCAHYAFGTINQEQWAKPDEEIPYEFWRDPFTFLAEFGYEVVDVPEAGDAVVYATRSREEEEAAGCGSLNYEHVGIVGEGGIIFSKLGQGPIVRHRAEIVPSDFGKYVYFLRKARDS